MHVPEDIGDGAAILTRFRHHRSQRAPNIRRVAATLRECFDVALAPDAALVTGSGINGRAAQWMPEQPPRDGMPSFMDRDPLVLLLSAAERGQQFIIFIDLLGTAATDGVANSDDSSGHRSGERRGLLVALKSRNFFSHDPIPS